MNKERIKEINRQAIAQAKKAYGHMSTTFCSKSLLIFAVAITITILVYVGLYHFKPAFIMSVNKNTNLLMFDHMKAGLLSVILGLLVLLIFYLVA